MSVRADEADDWDRLAGALNQYGVRHVAPKARSRGARPQNPEALFLDLAKARRARLREATIPLLLTHPELAPAAQAAIERLAGVERDQAIRRYVAACALQRMWRTRLELALGALPLVPAAYVAELDLPSLDGDHGRATLWALADQEEQRYGYNAWAGYTSLMELILAELDLKRWGGRLPRRHAPGPARNASAG